MKFLVLNGTENLCYLYYLPIDTEQIGHLGTPVLLTTVCLETAPSHSAKNYHLTTVSNTAGNHHSFSPTKKNSPINWNQGRIYFKYSLIKMFYLNLKYFKVGNLKVKFMLKNCFLKACLAPIRCFWLYFIYTYKFLKFNYSGYYYIILPLMYSFIIYPHTHFCWIFTSTWTGII